MNEIPPTGLVHPACLNFKWYEVWKSDTAERLEIDNTSSDPVVIENARQLVKHVLQPMRDQLGPLSPQSWLRVEVLEKIICKKSYRKWCKDNRYPVNAASWKKYFARKSHPKGAAVDIETTAMSNDLLFAWCKVNLKFDQLIREFPVKGVPNSGWVHISWAGTANRNQVFTIGAK